MRNCYSYLTLVLLLFSVFRLNAQTDIAIGTGTSGNSNSSYPCPLQDFWEGSRAQYLFRASELIAAGMGPGNINAVKFNVISLATSSNSNPHFTIHQQTIKIGTTAVATLNMSAWEPNTTVVFPAQDYLPVTGLNAFSFNAPFFWNGTDNIIVEVCNGAADNDTALFWTGNSVVPWTTNLSFNASNTFTGDDQGSLCGTINTNNNGTATTRPNIIFNWTPAAPCTGTPVAGTASSTASNVCLNEPFTLKLNGTTIASGLTYQWQSSSDNTNWSNIPGATTPSITISQSVSTYYRCQVTCTNTGGGTAASTSVQVTSPTLVSGSFTIDKNATTPLPPNTFLSFNDAYSFIKCGISGPVVFNVAPASGPYNEQLVMTPVPGASAINTVTFNGNGNTITSANTSGDRAVIKLFGTDHISFDSLVITATGTSYGFGVQLLNNADSNTISRCTINIPASSTSDSYAGIVISNSATSAITTGNTQCDGNLFSGNTITGGYYGITLVASTTNANIGNRFINNNVKDFYSYGMYVYGSSITTIEGNTFSRPLRTSLASTGYGIYCTQTNLVLNITRNIITNPFGGANNNTGTFYGIYFTSVDAFPQTENIISNNLIYNLTGSGSVYGIYNSSSDNAFYYHNTIVMDGTAPSGTATHVTRGFYQTSQAAGIDFRNNIIVISRGGPGSKHCIYFNVTNSTIISNRNDFYISSTTGTRNIGFYNNTNRATLAAWQSGAAQDANSVSTNPVFANPASGNFTPTSASVDNKGTSANILIDLYGNSRSSSTPDIGAIEFTPPPCLVPPVPGTALASASPVCAFSAVQLSLKDNSVGLTQTYRWEAMVPSTGLYTPIGNVLTIPDTSIIVNMTTYYRCAITCGAATEYSAPVLIEVTPRLPAGNYTIDPSGTGTNNFTSFNAAKEAMKCGIDGSVVFTVAPNSGPYNEQLILDSIPGTSATSTITFIGNGNTIKFSSNSSTERAVIKLRGADYVTFDSLVIDATGSGSYGYGVQLLSDADSNTFKSCRINITTTSSFSDYAGIVINAIDDGATSSGNTLCDGNTFDNNTVNGGYYGITLVGGSGALVSNNKFTNNTLANFYYYGIYLYYTANTLVEKNNISRPTRTSTGSFYGIYATWINDGLRVSKNRIHTPFGGNATTTNSFYGIYFTDVDATAGSESIISNNLIYDVNGNGDTYGLYNYSSDNAHYYHNTISLDDKNSTHTASYWTRGFYQTGDGEGIDFRNNIITITRTGAGPRHAIYMANAATQYVSDYNDLYVTGNSGAAFVGYDGTNRVTLADWKTATTQDAHSISMDPVYADPLVTFNFTPVVSPLDNGGTPVGIASDIMDVSRSSATPDIGAYEFAIPPCVQPPVAGTAVAIPNSGVCLGTTIQLTLTGNTSGGTQTYQWQSGADAAGPWTTISEVRYVKEFNIELTFNNYFRCKVVCGGDTSYSIPVQVVMNPAFLAGVYTIDPGAPAGTPKNFVSFTDAVAALECGITGAVTFNVAPGTYTEQVRMHKVAGAADTSRITFQSANGDAAAVILTFNGTSTKNYVLQLDSASFVTYKGISIVAANSSYGHAVELANTASYDSIVNCIVSGPAVTSTSADHAVVYAELLKGVNNVIKGNTISNGSDGIHLEGDFGEYIPHIVIDSNTISGMYQNGIDAEYVERLWVNKNKIALTAPMTSEANAIYAYTCDTAYAFNHNIIDISNTSGTKRGLYIQYCDASTAEPGTINGNIITAVTGNTGQLYGLYDYYSSYNQVHNNVIAVKTSSSGSYGLYITGGSAITCYNNSVHSTSTAASSNYSAYISVFSSTNGGVNIRNNIFSHGGGGIAYYVADPNYIFSDYNMLYTSGSTLIEGDGNDYTELQSWRNDFDQDLNSIVYKPAFTSDADLRPDVANPDVWAIHGRGVQILNNDHDIHDNPRPTTLTAGVPDLGAFEFLPTSIPPVLPATPATPVAGDVQTFMFGTDTVMKITWAPTSALPTNIEVRRYSGVEPPGLAPGQDHMYFYTDVDVTPAGPYNYSIQQFYLDPWQGFISSQPIIKLGRTNSAGEWLVDSTSVVDDMANTIWQTGLDSLDKFTGLTDGKAAVPPRPPYTSPDSSNRGKQFWVAYGHHYNFAFNDQDMVLYLSAQDSANVQVRINGTSWVRNYAIPANTVKVSDIIPKTGLSDARILDEGLYDRSISITSDVPIVAYAHIYASTNSGATMLLPVGTYGYEYVSLNSSQYYSTGGAGAYSWFYVIADHDSTLVEITPAVTTKGGRPANTPFTVLLNRGQVYNVMGTQSSSGAGTDMTGSLVRSLPNANGKCYPIAVFSGSSRTAICYTNNGDNMIQQVFPSHAWGKKYLAFATASNASTTSYNSNIFRVMVKDTSTNVKLNNVLLPHNSIVIPGKYYQFNTTSGDGPNGAIYVEADQPVLVAQYMVSTSANLCPGVTTTGSGGDPELIYISPVEQGIDKAAFFNTDKNTITDNYVNVIVPNGGLPSLTIDGGTTFSDVFPHPYLSGYTCIRQDLGGSAAQHTVSCDSPFTAITYGLGSAESYGYNAGTLVKNLQAISSINNIYDTAKTVSEYTCSKTKFKFNILLPVKPNRILWQLSEVSNLSPNQDVVQTDPVPVDSMTVNGLKYYKYTINTEYTFSAPGTYYVPIFFTHPSFESCNNSRENILQVRVIASPVADFTTSFSGCAGSVIQFNGAGTTSNGVTIDRWSWDFAGADSSKLQNPTYTFNNGGTYNIKLSVIGVDGCVGDTTRPITVNPAPVVEVVKDSLSVCAGETADFAVKDPVAGVTYQWYDAGTGGTVVGTGTHFTINSITATVSYWVEAVQNGCTSLTRKKVTALVAPVLTAPVVTVDSLATNLVRFKWTAVTGASGYEVSTNNGSNWTPPSSGPTGLTHTVAGLLPLQTVNLVVKALGGCEDMTSQPVTAKALPDGIFIPNSFTPNGDGLNDVLQVYGYVIKDLHFLVFNQWGERLFESRRQSLAWDGTYKGKLQPSGVYIYVCRITLHDGTVVDKKGSINLIR